MKTKTRIFNLFRRGLKFRPLEFILRRMVIGKDPNSLIARVTPNNYQYKRGSWRKFEKDGFNLKVDIHDYVGHYLYFQFKDKGQEKLLSIVNKGDNVLDIGTNIGSTILSFANTIGHEGMVYGFEPDILNYNLCNENIALNDFKNIRVSNFGLGDVVGKFKMITDTSSNRGMNRISYSSNESNSYEIEVSTIDTWLEENYINKINLIKIDVEGYELKVLKGGREGILKHKPNLFIELDDNNLKAVGDSATSLIKYLKDVLNYNHISNAETGVKINSDFSFVDCHFDIIVEGD